MTLDFQAINAAALRNARSLLRRLIPGGRFRSVEYIALNPRRLDRNLGSFRINYKTGEWADFAIENAKGGDLISLTAYVRDTPQGNAARELADMVGISMPGVSSAGINDSESRGTRSGNVVMPVPADAPAPPATHPTLGEPTQIWTYENAAGGVIGYVLRFDNADGKEFRPLTLWRHAADGRPEWRWQGWPNKRPLYGLRELAVRPFVPVVVCEGEKSADAAECQLPGFVVVTSPNGSDSADKADWSSLQGREVIIWPDADIPGREYAKAVTECLAAVGAKSVAVVSPPSGAKEGWDAADALEEGWTPDQAAALIAQAVPAVPSDAPKHNDGQTFSWDNPDRSLLDDRRGELPPFPLDTFSNDWQAWAMSAAHGAGTTVDHVLVPLLGIASSLIGTARRIKASTSWSEPFTMWTCVMGFSGTGKTPGLDVTKRALSKIEHDRRHLIGEKRREHESRIENAKAANKQWKAKVQEAVKAGTPAPLMPADADIPEPFVVPRFHISNSTIEKLAVLLQARPQGMLLICDELAGLFLNLSRYSGGTDREFWLEAWNGKYFAVERMSRPPVEIEHLLVGMTGGMQPDKLGRSFEGDADGLYARVLFSWPSEAEYQELTNAVEEIEPEFENSLIRLIDLATFEEGRLIIRNVPLAHVSRTQFEQFREFVHQKKSGLDGREREWFAKAPGHVLRLAGTLAYLDWARETACKASLRPEPTAVEARFVAAAVRLVRDYFWPHAQAALRQIGLTERHTKARKVLRWLRAERTLEREVSIEDIRVGALGRTVDAAGAIELIDALVRAAWLREAPTEKSGAGRRPRRWQINPLLWLPEIPQIPQNNHSQGREGVSSISGIPGKDQAASHSAHQGTPNSSDLPNAAREDAPPQIPEIPEKSKSSRWRTYI
jgi:hypothetical protein